MIKTSEAVFIAFVVCVISVAVSFSITYSTMSARLEKRFLEGVEFGYGDMCNGILPKWVNNGKTCYRLEENGTLTPVKALILTEGQQDLLREIAEDAEHRNGTP